MSSKLFYKKIDTCSKCAFYHVNNTEGFPCRCVLVGKDLENKEIPEWCPLIDYQEKIEANETENVWVKISGKTL
jgi:hypothetical protein